MQQLCICVVPEQGIVCCNITCLKIIILCDRSATFKSEKHNIMRPVRKVLKLLLALTSTLILGFKPHRIHDHTLLSYGTGSLQTPSDYRLFTILPWHRLSRKHSFQQFLYCCMFIQCCEHVYHAIISGCLYLFLPLFWHSAVMSVCLFMCGSSWHCIFKFQMFRCVIVNSVHCFGNIL
jgi:hypothetical protein